MTKKVLMIGWHPGVVNYDKWPGLTPEKLEAGLRADEKRLQEAGHDARVSFLHDGATATDEVVRTLTDNRFDVVMIGAGVRRDDDHFLTFERLVNIVHEHAPRARIAFNTGPTDSLAAVERWV